MSKKTKKKYTFFTLLGKIGDILLIPIFIISFIASGLVLFQNKSQGVSSVFNLSIVKVMTGSMIKSGFDIDDIVFVVKTDTKKLWGNIEGGDIIAFYQYADKADESLTKTQLQSVDEKLPVTQNAPEERKSVDEVKSYRVVFHQIVGVYQDETGIRYFETWGTSNGTTSAPRKDSVKIREDYVIGKYINTPVWIRRVMNWVSGSMGMVCCVMIPLGILLILENLELIEQISFLFIEKKLISGQLNWKNEDAKKLLKTHDVEKICKIILYSNVDETDSFKAVSLKDKLSEDIYHMICIRGTYPKNENEIAIDISVANKYGIAPYPGETLNLKLYNSQGIYINTKEFIVSGVFKCSSNEMVGGWYRCPNFARDNNSYQMPAVFFYSSDLDIWECNKETVFFRAPTY